MRRRSVIRIVLLGEAATLAIALVALTLWLLLRPLGDERGAAAALWIAAGAGVAAAAIQILLLNLLALASLQEKMEASTSTSQSSGRLAEHA